MAILRHNTLPYSFDWWKHHLPSQSLDIFTSEDPHKPLAFWSSALFSNLFSWRSLKVSLKKKPRWVHWRCHVLYMLFTYDVQICGNTISGVSLKKTIFNTHRLDSRPALCLSYKFLKHHWNQHSSHIFSYHWCDQSFLSSHPGLQEAVISQCLSHLLQSWAEATRTPKGWTHPKGKLPSTNYTNLLASHVLLGGLYTLGWSQ